jgi:thiamine pyrophosphokinase
VKRAILIGASPDLDQKELNLMVRRLSLSRHDYVIGIDQGLEYASRIKRLGAKLLAVGDWDSLKTPALLNSVPSLTLPPKKDESDLYWALRAGAALGARELICFGVSGGRLDHELAAYLELAAISEHRPALKVTALDNGTEAIFMSRNSEPWRRKLKRGTRVSVFALNGTATGVTLSGFEFPLQNARLAPSSHGLSNVASGGMS